jgi:ubiquinol-cytochrome c reductase cytochrome b subunit
MGAAVSSRSEALRKQYGWPSLGDTAASALLLIAASGIVLALHYHPGDEAYASVARIEQVLPGGWFVRRFHHFAGQLLLIGAVAHTVSVLWRRREGRFKPWRWAKAVSLLPLALAGCFTGFLLRGSAEGFGAAMVATGLAESVPLVGGVLARSIFRPEPHDCSLLLPYMHHLATVTVGLFYLSSEHIGRLRRRPASLAWTAALLALVALVAGVPTGSPPAATPEVVHGPWFFVGIQQLLHWLPPLLAGIALPVVALVLLWAVALVEEGSRLRTALVVVLGVGLAAYAAISLPALLG